MHALQFSNLHLICFFKLSWLTKLLPEKANILLSQRNDAERKGKARTLRCILAN